MIFDWEEVATLFIIFFVGFFVGAAVLNLYTYENDPNIILRFNNTYLDIKLEECQSMLSMAVYGKETDNMTGFLGLAYPAKGFFTVYTGKDQQCRPYMDIMETCAHEWAHSCADLWHPKDVLNVLTQKDIFIENCRLQDIPESWCD
jgi:hypothetical protein